MLKNYLVIAWRQIVKNKLYAAINILGLVVGLAIYLFGTLLVDYELSHDLFFENSERTFTIGSVFSPTADVGIAETDSIYTAFAPFIESEIEDAEAVVRTVRREFLLSVEDDHYYEQIRFVDPGLLKIFDFHYLEGSGSALEDPSGLLLTRRAARKFFGDEPALGKVITLDHEHSLHVTAVIEDLPPNTHLNGSLIQDANFDFIAPLAALNTASDYDLAGNFNNLSMGDVTYLLMPAGTTVAQLQPRLNGIFERHYPDKERKVVAGVKVRPLVEANSMLWDAIGLPILESVRLLGLLVLIVAIVNYSNLATAQSLGRSREIGLRKTMGASRRQLVIQFLTESLCVATIAMLIALALIEIAVPLFNTASGKGLHIDYLAILPWLLATTIAVGLVAGAYPSYLITQVTPIDALRDGGGRGAKGGIFRSIMLGLQFSITIFMLAMVVVMFLQNQKIQNSAEIYPKSQIITLSRLDVESIRNRLDTLKNELKKIPGVTAVSYSSTLPYQQSNSSLTVSRDAGGEASDMLMNRLVVDDEFFATYNIPLLAGRPLSNAIAADTVKKDVVAANAVLNELALAELGLGSPEDALGEVFYQTREDAAARAFTVVGVLPDQNFQGFHNKIKPTMFYLNPQELNFGSVRVENVAMGRALSDVEAVWKDVIPDYPIQSRFLDEEFNETYAVYSGMSWTLGGFAAIAMLLSLIGLFGLAAFMAAGKTKEIGVRKVMGANMLQIVRLLIWQFSRPVLWALLVALPLAYIASNLYLDFFADRIGFTAPIVAGAGILAVLFAWAVVAIHAVRVARANPIYALRYE